MTTVLRRRKSVVVAIAGTLVVLLIIELPKRLSTARRLVDDVDAVAPTVSTRHVGVLLSRQTHTDTVVDTHCAKAAHGGALHPETTHVCGGRDLLALDTTMVLHWPSCAEVCRTSKGGHDAPGRNLLLQQVLLLLLERFDLSLQSHLKSKVSVLRPNTEINERTCSASIPVTSLPVRR
jgi:hypothetical protein